MIQIYFERYNKLIVINILEKKGKKCSKNQFLGLKDKNQSQSFNEW